MLLNILTRWYLICWWLAVMQIDAVALCNMQSYCLLMKMIDIILDWTEVKKCVFFQLNWGISRSWNVNDVVLMYLSLQKCTDGLWPPCVPGECWQRHRRPVQGACPAGLRSLRAWCPACLTSSQILAATFALGFFLKTQPRISQYCLWKDNFLLGFGDGINHLLSVEFPKIQLLC